MKLPAICIAIIVALYPTCFSIAGGGSCRFTADGIPLLSRSPLLAEIIDSKFSVENNGKMGPMDAPFNGGRLYTYMEFQATAAANSEQKFTIRLHFKRSKTKLTLRSAELVRLDDPPKEK